MTVEQLMQPRYKVINGYPHSPFNIGQILFKVKPLYGLDYIATFDGQQNIDNSWVTQYPHIFQKLQWYEERKIEDMPEYVKHVNSGQVKKVTKYLLGQFGNSFYSGEIEKRGKYKGTEISYKLNGCEPATEEEYNQFITPQTL